MSSWWTWAPVLLLGFYAFSIVAGLLIGLYCRWRGRQEEDIPLEDRRPLYRLPLYPPAHPNCRCVTPALDDLKLTRAGRAMLHAGRHHALAEAAVLEELIIDLRHAAGIRLEDLEIVVEADGRRHVRPRAGAVDTVLEELERLSSE